MKVQRSKTSGKDVIKCLSETFNTKVPLNMTLCVFGIYPKDFILTSTQTKLLDFGLLQARRAVALCWKIHHWMWRKELLVCISLERLCLALGTIHEYHKGWKCRQCWEIFCFICILTDIGASWVYVCLSNVRVSLMWCYKIRKWQ